VTQTTEAIYTNGVLKPTGDLDLREQQRVRVTVETIEDGAVDRAAAVARLKAGIDSMQFFSNGRLPRCLNRSAPDVALARVRGTRPRASALPRRSLSVSPHHWSPWAGLTAARTKREVRRMSGAARSIASEAGHRPRSRRSKALSRACQKN
jgi:predicted DNA-binding antitoxin AbrB/MazE fold protein